MLYAWLLFYSCLNGKVKLDKRLPFLLISTASRSGDEPVKRKKKTFSFKHANTQRKRKSEIREMMINSPEN